MQLERKLDIQSKRNRRMIHLPSIAAITAPVDTPHI
jgi:hypothetical protein